MQIFNNVANIIILSMFGILLIALLFAIFQCLKAFKIERLKNELTIKRSYAEIFISSANRFDRELIKSQLIDTFSKNKIPFSYEEIDKLIETAKQDLLGGK
jgi:(p)ppGpp synthase/HD superfamily hydrolase